MSILLAIILGVSGSLCVLLLRRLSADAATAILAKLICSGFFLASYFSFLSWRWVRLGALLAS